MAANEQLVTSVLQIFHPHHVLYPELGVLAILCSEVQLLFNKGLEQRARIFSLPVSLKPLLSLSKHECWCHNVQQNEALPSASLSCGSA